MAHAKVVCRRTVPGKGLMTKMFPKDSASSCYVWAFSPTVSQACTTSLSEMKLSSFPGPGMYCPIHDRSRNMSI